MPKLQCFVLFVVGHYYAIMHIVFILTRAIYLFTTLFCCVVGFHSSTINFIS